MANIMYINNYYYNTLLIIKIFIFIIFIVFLFFIIIFFLKKQINENKLQDFEEKIKIELEKSYLNQDMNNILKTENSIFWLELFKFYQKRINKDIKNIKEIMIKLSMSKEEIKKVEYYIFKNFESLELSKITKKIKNKIEFEKI